MLVRIFYKHLYYSFGKQLSKIHPKAEKYLYYLIQVSQLGESIIRKYTAWKCLLEHFKKLGRLCKELVNYNVSPLWFIEEPLKVMVMNIYAATCKCLT